MNIAVIIAGGSGHRMGQDIPKQFINVFDKPILIYTLEGFQKTKNQYILHHRKTARRYDPTYRLVQLYTSCFRPYVSPLYAIAVRPFCQLYSSIIRAKSACDI